MTSSERQDHIERQEWLAFPSVTWALVALRCLTTFGYGLLAAFAIGLMMRGELFLVFGLLAILVFGYRENFGRVMSLRRSRATWQESLSNEYASWDKRTTPSLNKLAFSLHGLRLFLRRLHGLRTGSPGERLRHARRWALACEVVWLSFMIGIDLGVGVLISTALWRSGYIGRPLPPDVIERANYGIPDWAPGPETVSLPTIRAAALALDDYAWTFTDAVPGINLTQTFGWDRPTFYAQDLPQRLLAELFKIAIAVPLITFTIHMFTDRTGLDDLQTGREPP
jgi:hypothetical protein